ncbi:proteasome subunit beta [Actinophytocola xinjiangensis]|uniref:Proteasome subunit beta n=1 Tax=Actinophytocola xinjiangensis TaxID=485602 RepID=A0A7Z0WPD2_9PSEU|nr:proteasome subunit beta [Actinophytocola xinjiangensis]OLF12243.1 proteasome subunit beta [Actinophytocola xinjiangensis]
MEHTPSRAMPGATLPAAYLTAETSSFTDFLRAQAPHLLPGNLGGVGEPVRARHASELNPQPPHGTTIVAVTFDGGVLIAGDRRATSGNLIAQRDMEKVFVTDDYSAVGIAGTAGLAVELVKLFTLELSHYEKIEGVSLSLDGKTNKLATMVRGNLDVAMAGLAVLPLFVGFDLHAQDPAKAGRIVSYDVVGGRYEERAGFHSVGSGSLFARSALKKLYDPGSDAATAIRHAVEALYDAADDDSATGGPDLARKIYPSVVTITAADGAVQLPEEEAAEVAESVVTARSSQPRG